MKTDMPDRPVERLASEATVNLRHEPLKNLTGYETGYHTIAFGLDLENDFAGWQQHDVSPC